MRVLLAYDGSRAARRALRRAAEVAAPDGAVGVVNVMAEPGIGSRLGPHTEERGRQARLLGEAERELGARGVDAQLMASVGGAAGEIVAAARRMRADLIVLGRHGGRPPRVLGSVSGRVMRHAPCDVLVVHDEAVPSGRPGTGG